MKVKDILLVLQQADPETELVFSMSDGCCGDREWLEIVDVDFNEHLQYNSKSELVRSKDFPLGTVEFYFAAPWFLASCRKAGAAKRAAQDVIDAQIAWQKEQEEKAKK